MPKRSLELIYCPKSAINLDLGEYFCDAHIRVEIKAAHGFTVWASNSKNGTTIGKIAGTCSPEFERYMHNM